MDWSGAGRFGRRDGMDGGMRVEKEKSYLQFFSYSGGKKKEKIEKKVSRQQKIFPRPLFYKRIHRNT